MGMYTELDICCELRKDTPKEVLDVLEYMAAHEKPSQEAEAKLVKDHPLFKTASWSWMLHGTSAYFDREPASKFLREGEYGIPKLRVLANIKNYDQEWQHFISFIEPWIYTMDYLGTYRYEEQDIPTLLFYSPKSEKVLWAAPEDDVREKLYGE